MTVKRDELVPALIICMAALIICVRGAGVREYYFRFAMTDMEREREIRGKDRILSLLEQKETKPLPPHFFLNQYGHAMRTPGKFYQKKLGEKNLLADGGMFEVSAPSEILPDSRYDVISVSPVELVDIADEAVNPEIWELFLRHATALSDASKAIRKLASDLEEDFDARKKEGRPWYNDVVYGPKDSMWNVDKHWDFGWFCVAAHLLGKKELLAFFAFLSQIDTHPKDVIWRTFEDTSPALAELLREFSIFCPEDGVEKMILKDTPLRKLSKKQKQESWSVVHPQWWIYSFVRWQNKMYFLKNFGWDDDELECCYAGRAVYPLSLIHI